MCGQTVNSNLTAIRAPFGDPLHSPDSVKYLKPYTEYFTALADNLRSFSNPGNDFPNEAPVIHTR